MLKEKEINDYQICEEIDKCKLNLKMCFQCNLDDKIFKNLEIGIFFKKLANFQVFDKLNSLIEKVKLLIKYNLSILKLKIITNIIIINFMK